MNYIDLFVMAVPTANRRLYQQHAEATAALFRDHGGEVQASARQLFLN